MFGKGFGLVELVLGRLGGRGKRTSGGGDGKEGVMEGIGSQIYQAEAIIEQVVPRKKSFDDFISYVTNAFILDRTYKT